MKIFVADDSSIYRKMLVSAFSQLEGAEVVGTAEHATDAIEGIARLRPDIVVLDVRLRSGSGIDILHAIKRNLSASPIAIVLTNYPYDQYRRTCMSLGADYFFHKATEFSNCVNTLKSLLPASSIPLVGDALYASSN